MGGRKITEMGGYLSIDQWRGHAWLSRSIESASEHLKINVVVGGGGLSSSTAVDGPPINFLKLKQHNVCKTVFFWQLLAGNHREFFFLNTYTGRGSAFNHLLLMDLYSIIDFRVCSAIRKRWKMFIIDESEKVGRKTTTQILPFCLLFCRKEKRTFSNPHPSAWRV